MTTTAPFHSNACALIIGVGDYRAFDATGACDLAGSALDAIAVQRCCAVLGMASESIHVVRDAAETQGLPFALRAQGDTSRKGLLAELTWLRQQLDAGRHGLLWYSGHGAHTTKDGLLLCPSDTTPSLGSTIPFRALRELLGPQATKNLTVVLDCCHGGPSTDARGRRSKTLGGDAVAPDLADGDLMIGAVVIAACAPGEQTQQSWFASMPHGAFTWALLAAANQWEAAQQGGNVALDLNYRQLVKRATVLLQALDFEGTPQIYPPRAGALAVLQMGDEVVSTTEVPDGQRSNVQIDGGYKYKFQGKDAAGAWIDLAVVLATLASPISLELGTNQSVASTNDSEHWYVNTNNIAAMSNYSEIQITKEPLSSTEKIDVMATSTSTTGYAGQGGSLTTSTPYFVSSELPNPDWSRSTPATTGTVTYFKGLNGKSQLWMAWDVGTNALNRVIWFLVTSTKPTTVQPADFSTFSYKETGRPASYYQASSS